MDDESESTTRASSSQTASSRPSQFRNTRLWELMRHAGRINYPHELLFAVITVLLSLLLAACTSSNSFLRGIYILSFSYRTASQTSSGANDTISAVFNDQRNETTNIVEVRVGYFGICVMTNMGSWICDTQSSNLARAVRAANQSDPLNLLWIGNRFQSEAITTAFVFISVFFVLGVLLLGLLSPLSSETLDNLSRGRLMTFLNYWAAHSPTARAYSTWFMLSATASAFIAAMWHHLAGASGTALTKHLAFEAIECHTGTASIALGWVTFVLALCGVASLSIQTWSASRPSEPGRVLMPEEADAADETTRVDMEQGEQLPPPPQYAPQMRQQIDAELLVRLLYITGQRGTAYYARNPDPWPRGPRMEREMPHGYAETLIDEDEY
ncbi:Ca2+ regulator and membrane fusion protein Fig1-domain-containing protein [Thelonectria olida]|uniref:Ca2+ regulator and membrane fusion protein Fig1-domain-containing protein n=1 Tax=Thelonectria olida TaxID=1576542 RepID=A0A9P9ASC3_9HYPO|nr:Ca2+ regulator and membrane fusion protein Fig1-domain-containing protein [Thelonectria olida]